MPVVEALEDGPILCCLSYRGDGGGGGRKLGGLEDGRFAEVDLGVVMGAVCDLAAGRAGGGSVCADAVCVTVDDGIDGGFLLGDESGSDTAVARAEACCVEGGSTDEATFFALGVATRMACAEPWVASWRGRLNVGTGGVDESLNPEDATPGRAGLEIADPGFRIPGFVGLNALFWLAITRSDHVESWEKRMNTHVSEATWPYTSQQYPYTSYRRPDRVIGLCHSRCTTLKRLSKRLKKSIQRKSSGKSGIRGD